METNQIMLKRVVNLSGSLLVWAWDRLQNLASRMMGQKPRGGCVVLAYHSVLSKQRAQFARQMDVVARTTTPVAAGIGTLPEPSRRYAAVTFDDGLENVITNALPELAQRKIPSTLFIVTEALGTNPKWEYFGGDDPSQQRVMTEQQLQQLPSELVTIGSHTMTHPVLPTVLNHDQLQKELAGSRAKLESILGREVKLFSFPYGAFSDEVVEGCREACYDRVFTALPGFAFAQPNEFVSGRVGVNLTDWPIEFRLKLAGAYRWLPYAFALKRKLRSLLGSGRTPALSPQTGEKRIA
jgi:peptidoglycan/xylan/chitin deacetylase (PgdA/CDA1 family)